jgi:hypothetical protein
MINYITFSKTVQGRKNKSLNNISSSFREVQESQVSELQLIWKTKEKDFISCHDSHVFFKFMIFRK